MYVITEQSGIINLDCYPRVNVYCKNSNTYLLCAFSKLDARATDQDGVVIAKFDNKEDADYTFRNLSEAITANRPTWDVSTVELLSHLWNQVREQISSNIVPTDVQEALKLKISGLNEITIIYPSDFDIEKGTYMTKNDRQKIEDEVIIALKARSSEEVEWKVEWESHD